MDEPLPTLTIPLNAGDALDFDFDAPYQQTYTGLFFGDEVDYAALPVKWDRYSDSDQARILSRLLAIRGGQITEDADPQPVDLLAFENALRQWDS